MVTVIGGGGAGLYFSQKYKQKNLEEEVIVIEEHKEIGKPIQCTGILTDDILKLMPKKDIEKVTLNKITKTTIHSPNNSVQIPISTNYIICNSSFIEQLHNKAEKQEVTIKNGYRYLNNKGSNIEVRNIDTKKIETIKDNALIGADGPGSLVARNNNLMQKRRFLTGVQARVRIKDFDKKNIDFYPYIGDYAWFTPESDEIARIGVAAEKNAKQIFDDFIKKYPGKILEMQGGPIPLHKPGTRVQQAERRTQRTERSKNKTEFSSQSSRFSVSLVGDSALQIKNTTGGGIIPGMKAAQVLAEDINKYPKKLGKLNRELYTHYTIHKILQKYTNKDWDQLIERTKNENVQKIIRETNRDQALKLLLKLATTPSMIKEGLKAITKLSTRK